jgi:hypothetical protein
MLGFWKKYAKPGAKATLLPIHTVKAAAAPKHETFLARARRNDSDGSQRRIRQLVEQNRLL